MTNDINDSKTLLSISAHRSTTHKYFNFHYGLGGTMGRYRFDKPINEDVNFKSRAFYSLNSKAGINLNLPTKKMDWRVLGAELTYNYEFGPYQKTLDDVRSNSEGTDLLIFNKKSILAYNFGSEAVFKLDSGNALSFGYYMGEILNRTGNLAGRNTFFMGLFTSYKINSFTLSLIREGGKAQIGSSKFGLSYQLF